MVAPVKAGDILADKYCVQRILGVGGMGVVVAAEHVALHQQVALKFMLPEALSDETAVGRFMREARAAVRLRSEHVARVMDVGCMQNGAPYIVMEFLHGEDMEDVIRKESPMQQEVAVDFVLQACMAMAEAHSIGIVHRDLKPANLFVTTRPDGSRQVKVLDFGISKVQDSGQQVSQTKSSMAMGSPGYMAPEQMRSAKHADHRADIWALGTILYKMLSNKLPFYAESAPEMFAAVLTGESTPLPKALPSVNPELAEVVHRCLERDRELRYGSVAELARALSPFGNERAGHMARSIANVGVAAEVATRPSTHPADVPAADTDGKATVGMPGTGARGAGANMPATKLSDSQPPHRNGAALAATHSADQAPAAESTNFGDNALTTGRASSGQAVVAAPSTTTGGGNARRGPLPIAIGAAAAVALTVGAMQLFKGDSSGGATQAPTSGAATSIADAGATQATAPTAPPPTDAAAVEAAAPVAEPDAAPPPDAAPAASSKRPRRPSRPRRPAKPESKPTPAAKPEPPVEPKPKPKPKPTVDEDPFGTMQ